MGKALGNRMTNIRTWLQGKKTYITAAVGILTAIGMYAGGQIELTGLVAAVWAAVQTCFIRAGVDNAAAKAQQQ